MTTCGAGTAAVAAVFADAAAAKLGSMVFNASDARLSEVALSAVDVASAVCLLNVERVRLARHLAAFALGIDELAPDRRAAAEGA